MKTEIFKKIDDIIKQINIYKLEPALSYEIKSRNNRKIPIILSENDLIEILIKLMVYSQNANSKSVRQIIDSRILNKVFAGFDINEIVKMNPCDLADEYWDKISGIRQQAKLFHIVSLARKIKKIGSFNKLLTETNIPKYIKTKNDIDYFWIGFKKLKKKMEENKIPFFRSTTSLLHLLLELGYDCVKPDLVIMKISKNIGIINNESANKKLIKTVRTIQEYSIDRKIRPSVVDLYFLIYGGQIDAKKFVLKEFYKENK